MYFKQGLPAFTRHQLIHNAACSLAKGRFYGGNHRFTHWFVLAVKARKGLSVSTDEEFVEVPADRPGEFAVAVLRCKVPVQGMGIRAFDDDF